MRATEEENLLPTTAAGWLRALEHNNNHHNRRHGRFFDIVASMARWDFKLLFVSLAFGEWGMPYVCPMNIYWLQWSSDDAIANDYY